MPRRILVTGCARSSTGYFAALLRRLGLPCGHEALFDPESGSSPPAWPSAVIAESSWLAAPFVVSLPEDFVVVHVVRAPELVLPSLWRIGLFRTRSIYRRHAEQHCAELREGTPIERTAKYWIHWNRLAERARERPGYVRIRVEALDETAVLRIAELADLDWAPEHVRSALAELPKTVNTAGDKSRDAAVDWSELARTPLAAELDALALRYGCPPPSLVARRRSGAA